ncbi:MAG TPA: methyltransferase domain-containing protein [Acidimicrobiales bacterium]|nr:methyltransferase domain-containing protein [Acidimicrobiales bacterium]
MSTETLRPVTNTPPTTLAGKLKFYGRMLVDFQVWTVYRDLRRFLPRLRGDVLDVGCGESPYRFLLDRKATSYVGIDVFDADKFDYTNPDVVPFDGEHIPFGDEHFDAVICTEVLEHVPHFQTLVDEIHRVMRHGGEAFVTVPWSARFHYIPYDFFRYTPSSLETIFGKFRDVDIEPRGTDVSAIGAKVVLLWFRNVIPARRRGAVFLPLWVLATPLVAVVVAVAHISILARSGSSDDPLGYTIYARK